MFEHLYDDNFASEPGISTHYVVLACGLLRQVVLEQLPGIQHGDWRFWSIVDLLASDEVHVYTKAYFTDRPSTLVFRS